jgi:hypothetical protein
VGSRGLNPGPAPPPLEILLAALATFFWLECTLYEDLEELSLGELLEML